MTLNNSFRALLMVGLLFAPWDSLVGAQVPAPQIPTLNANVRQVLVPVVVTDKRGHPVSGLHQTDFEVFEDEVPQHIVAFSETYDASIDVSQPPGVTAARAKSMTPGADPRVGPNSPTRTYVVCVDTLHSSIGDVVQARGALKKFFEHEKIRMPNMR